MGTTCQLRMYGDFVDNSVHCDTVLCILHKNTVLYYIYPQVKKWPNIPGPKREFHESTKVWGQFRCR